MAGVQLRMVVKYQYLVVPAPHHIKRDRKIKSFAERLSFEVSDLLNAAATEDWEFLRAETFTAAERPGLFSKPVERIETVLVFRRPLDSAYASAGEAGENDAKKSESSGGVKPGPRENPTTGNGAMPRAQGKNQPASRKQTSGTTQSGGANKPNNPTDPSQGEPLAAQPVERVPRKGTRGNSNSQ